MNMKKVFNLILSLSMSFGLVGCSQKKLANGEVTVLYTNDVHGYINNKVKNENDEEVDGLSYANVKALKDDLTSEGKNVLLVDAGDHTQGTAYSSMSEGIGMIDIMNEVGYDLATLGNHEFDYGQYQAFKFMDEANFDYVSCNFYTTEDNKLVLEPYKILEAGDLKIAFVGVSTPETISSSTPSYFQDEDGNYVYNFYSGEDGQELYDSVQSAIDEASKEADVVIGLGHLGVYDSAAPYRSIDVIENTTGLDAFIDGHSHTEIEGEIIQDKDGNDVVLTQTKSYLAYIGEMNITVTDGKVSVSTQLIDSYDSEDETVKEMEDKIVDQANEELNVKVADESVPFYISDPETGERLVRKMETNSGDITADAYYWYFNEEKEMECDVAINNGGGVRGDFPNGILTYGDCKTVMPFGNVICLVKVTGQTLLDALENGVISSPDETAIQHCAGMKYSVDTSIESTVQVDENGLWTGGPTGEYRVHDVEIYNRETGEYEPLDLEKTYTLAGNNYTLRNGGGGMTMLRDDAELVLDYVGEDYMIFADYLKSFTNNSIKTENSPLASYKNYLINYENLYGSGRITIE
jgi:2',3'-cyclic-nucleotide 2'-phosphodiesterase (5'-nucleotidase family)